MSALQITGAHQASKGVAYYRKEFASYAWHRLTQLVMFVWQAGNDDIKMSDDFSTFNKYRLGWRKKSVRFDMAVTAYLHTVVGSAVAIPLLTISGNLGACIVISVSTGFLLLRRLHRLCQVGDAVRNELNSRFPQVSS